MGVCIQEFRLRIQNALLGYVMYLWTTVWPAKLAAFYPLRDIAMWEVAGAAALLLTLTAMAFAVRRSHPYAFVGWLWYVVTVAPVIGLMQAGEQARADRFMYVPIVGLLIIVSWGGRDVLRRLAIPPRAAIAAAGVVVVAAAWVARAQARFEDPSLSLSSRSPPAAPRPLHAVPLPLTCLLAAHPLPSP